MFVLCVCKGKFCTSEGWLVDDIVSLSLPISLPFFHGSSFRFARDAGLDGGHFFGDRLWVSVVLKEMGE